MGMLFACCTIQYWFLLNHVHIYYVTQEKGVQVKYCMRNDHRFKNWLASCISAP